MSSNATVYPLVSVVIPAYNCERFIGEAVESALSQDYPNKEVIVVDDGSEDATLSEIQRFGQNISLCQQRNGGPGAARNHGARFATGEYLAFLDGDDVWLPRKLSAQVEHITANRDIGLVYGSWRQWHPKSDGTYPPASSFATDFDSHSIETRDSGSVYPLLLLDSIVCTISVLMPRLLFEQLGGFNERLRRGEDYELWIRVSREVQIHKLSMTTALYRMHQTNTTQRPTLENYEYLVVLEALRRYGVSGPDGTTVSPEALKRRLSALCFQHGYQHFWRGSPGAATQGFCLAREHGDRSVKTLAYATASKIRAALQQIN